MCAINGFNFKDEGLIKKMNQATSHRGPDGTGVFLNDEVSLGHNRLSIIDLSESAGQPMESFDGRHIIVFNGEIYNFKGLKNELTDYPFKTKSDTEVILAAYGKWGHDCVKKMNGIFAFAIWDKEKKEMFLARDHAGVKPLYYYLGSSTSSGQARFIFSSEIKAILEHGIEKKISKDSLNFYFHLNYVPQPFTIFENIFKLPSASYAVLKNNKLEIKNYWQPEMNNWRGSEKKARSKIMETLDSAVEIQLISDRPLGVFLSGGIDSSSILYFVSKRLGAGVKTFSVGFDIEGEGEKFNADFNLARRTAKFFGSDHHEFLISGKDVLDNLEKAAYHMDEPVSNHTQAVTMLLSKYAAKEATVVLGGDGGDEIFGGYDRYKRSKIISDFQKLPAFARNILNPLSEKLNMRGAQKYLSFMSQKGDALKRAIKPDFIDYKKVEDFFNSNYFSGENIDYENDFMFADFKTWLADESLMRTDKMSMAYGLEERVPFLDPRVIELGYSIPSKYKVSYFNSKIILKEAMKPHLPDYLFNQPKRGWFSPMAKWLRTDLKDFAYDVLSPDYCPATREFFDFKEIGKILDGHMDKSEYNLNIIWSLISFQLWYKRFM